MTHDIEGRLRSDLPALADQLERVESSHFASRARSPRSHRLALVAASVVVLVAVVGTVIAVGGRPDQSNDLLSGPAQVPTTKAVTPSGGTVDALVTLNLYSGVPNPTWVPTATEVQQLSVLVDALTVSATPVDPARGGPGMPFLLTGVPSTKYTHYLAISPSGITTGDGHGGEIPLVDRDGALMRTLIDMSLMHITDPGVLSVVNAAKQGM